MLDKFYPITYRTDLSNYEINKRGQVRSKLTNRVLNGSNNKGYRLYTLKNDNGKVVSVLAHIMVANQFIPNPENKPLVNHIDENGMNPCIDNLEWATHKENSNHGTCQKRSADKRQYPINQYNLNGKYMRTWKNIAVASYVYGVSKDTMTSAVNGKCKSCSGFIWRKYDGTKDDLDISYRNDWYLSGKYKTRAKQVNPIKDEYLYEETVDSIIDYLKSMPYIPKADKEMLERLRKMCS